MEMFLTVRRGEMMLMSEITQRDLEMTDSSHGAGMMVATGRLTAEGGVCGDVTASCAQSHT